MMNFGSLQSEVKRRSTRDQGGTTFDTGIKNAINFALFRISREAPWRSMRRKATFDTVFSYKKGSGAVSCTTSSNLVSVTGATFLTDQVKTNRKVKLSASSTYYYVKSFPSETTMTLDMVFNSASSTDGTYEILPQEEYVLPIQAGHRAFLWHEGFGYPFKMQYITDQFFFEHGVYLTMKYIPTHYRMWGEDMVLAQPSSASVLSIASSSTADTSIDVTVFGTVSGYPDYEVITTDGSSGATATTGSKLFSAVERVTKSASTTGRLTVTSDGAKTTVVVLPVGETTDGVQYKKIQVYPLPTKVFPINVQYYKDPYRLVNDKDVHEMGRDFDEAIILLATTKIKAESNQSEADRFYALFLDELKSLKKTNVDKIDWFPTLRRPKQSPSDLLVAPNLLFRQAGPNFGPATRM